MRRNPTTRRAFAALLALIAALDHAAADRTTRTRTLSRRDRELEELKARIAMLKARYADRLATLKAAKTTPGNRNTSFPGGSGLLAREVVAAAALVMLAAAAAFWPATDDARLQRWTLTIKNPALEARFTGDAFRSAYSPLVVFLAC